MNTFHHEKKVHGTPDFPIELYMLDYTHPRYKMQMHWHKEFEIIRVLNGVLCLRLNERDFTLKKGQSVFVPGNIMHSANPYDCNYECLVFSPFVLYSAQVCRALVKTHMQKPVVYSGNSRIDSIFDSMKSKEKGFELDVTGNLYLIAADTIKSNNAFYVPPNDKLEKVKSAMLLIEEGYASKITLDELAAACGLSPNYFCRYFKEIVGQTPIEYITVYRIEAACEMLAGGEKNVTDVCFSCGFNDLSYFIHVFKKHMGVSPREYCRSRS